MRRLSTRDFKVYLSNANFENIKQMLIDSKDFTEDDFVEIDIKLWSEIINEILSDWLFTNYGLR